MEDDENKDQIKQQLTEEEDEEKEQEAEEEASNNPEGAGSKFEHSMDDENEEEQDNGKKKKIDNKKDSKDNKNENKNEDNNDNKDEDNNNKNTPNNNQENNNNSTTGNREENNENIDKNDFKDDYGNAPEAENSNNSNKGQDKDPKTSEMPSEATKNTRAPLQAAESAETEAAATEAAEAATAAHTVAEANAAQNASAVAEQVAATAAKGATSSTAGAAASSVAVPILIVLGIILIIIILIGVAGFFMTMPQFLWNKLKKLALDIWDGVQGYVIGMDEAMVNKDDIIGVAQYLYDMGYDLVGMGFAENVEIYGQKDSKGNEIPVEGDHVKNEIKKIDAPFLRAYLVAENRTYLINNFCFNLKDFVNSFFDGSFFREGHDTWGTGLINLDDELLDSIGMPIMAIRVGEFNLGELIAGVKVERETNTLRIRRLNLDLNIFNTRFDYTYFSLAGWAGRYGKPFELMLTVHLATMSPDLAKEIALNKDLDGKVNIKLRKAEFNGKMYIDGKSIEDIKEDETYDEDTIKELEKFEKKYATEIKTSIPYISSVTNHWFRNVYFEGTSSTGANGRTQVGIDEDEDGLEDYNEPTGVKTQKTRSLTSDDDVYTFGDEMQAEIEYQGDEKPAGITGKITFKGTIPNGVTQNKDAVRGVTNPTTKKLFSQKYYIYDGTITTAKGIQKARRTHDDSLKQPVRFTKDSLNAFAMLENSETLDAQFIYRDLKELVIELGYFEREDFDVIEKKILEWPIPDYIPGEWPDRKIEKQVLEYGTLIACDETVADSLGLTLEDVQKLTGESTGEEDSESTGENTDTPLKDCVFIGDSYIVGLEANGGIDGAKFYGKTGVTAQYWLNNLNSLPDSASRVCVYLGVNNPSDHESMKSLIDALSQKYEGKNIYVIEVMHLGKNYNNVDAMNSKIDTYNAQIREKCNTLDNVSFIDTSEGLTSGGYLANTDSAGIHMQAVEYPKWAQNIANKIQDKRRVSGNDTNEQFAVDLLNYAKSLLEQMKEKNFTYGTPETIPPKSDERVMSEEGFVAWALNRSGYADQPENGLTLGSDGDFIDYCEEKNFKRIDDESELQPGDIVFTGQADGDGKKANGVYICAGEGKRYQVTSASDISADQPLSGGAGGFMCAYRVTGGSAISTGFAEGLDVVSMGNGKVIELLDEGNNLFSLNGLSRQIYGQDASTQVDEVPGRQQTDEGLKIKLTDTALKGYTLIMYGFDVNGISEGQEVQPGDILGQTVNSDICIILLDRDKAVVEDVEEYMKVPKKEKKSSGSGSESGKLYPGNNVEEKVWNALIQAGYSPTAVAAAMGNIYGESGFQTSAVEGGSGEGYGLCQWSFGRKQQLFAFAQARGVDPSDEDLQVEFLLAELTPGGGADGYATYQFSGYEDQRQIWETSSSIEEATTAFRVGFERAGVPRDEARIDAAKRYYEKYA